MFFISLITGIVVGSVVGYLLVRYYYNDKLSPMEDTEETSNGDVINEFEDRE